MTRVSLLDRIDPAPVLAEQHARSVNFDPDEVDDSWHHDHARARLGSEPPGAPRPDGVWETACRLVAAYEMADPALIRAVYDPAAPLHGRDMLLEGRFLVLRFYMGVRITDVIDEQRGSERVWGWAYETLQGHLERGRMAYEVVKHEDTGDVELVISAYSEGAPTLGPVTGLGWKLFGRQSQLRFYHECGRRLARAVQRHVGEHDPVPERRTVEGLVLAPSDARLRPHHRLSVRRHHPG
ncbi:MAG TPA: DUF1990 family protein [Marmoricola sp.]